MVYELSRLRIDVTDDEFNTIYPARISELSRKHWTPIAVAKAAAQFLVTLPDTQVLDIGSGAGKFCFVGAAHTKGHFTGVEQRPELVYLTTNLTQDYHVANVKWIHANITSIDFSQYNAFYFFNSFYENIDIYDKIDDTIELHVQLYETYSLYTFAQLTNTAVGVRLATYCTPVSLVPSCFQLVESLFSGRLNLWQKVI